MEHAFDIEIAKTYGIEEAIVLKHIGYWIAKNAANKVNFHDGAYWTYNSIKAFAELFPYLSETKIRRVLKHLIDEGLIITGNFSEDGRDRSLWYALTEKCIGLLDFAKWTNAFGQNEQMHLSESANAFGQNEQNLVISDVKQQIVNTDNNRERVKRERFSPPELQEVKDYVSEKGINVDADAFYSYYESNGWKVGKNSMKNWRAALKMWASREKSFKRDKVTNRGSGESSFESADFIAAALRKSYGVEARNDEDV